MLLISAVDTDSGTMEDVAAECALAAKVRKSSGLSIASCLRFVWFHTSENVYFDSNIPFGYFVQTQVTKVETVAKEKKVQSLKEVVSSSSSGDTDQGVALSPTTITITTELANLNNREKR